MYLVLCIQKHVYEQIFRYSRVHVNIIIARNCQYYPPTQFYYTPTSYDERKVFESRAQLSLALCQRLGLLHSLFLITLLISIEVLQEHLRPLCHMSSKNDKRISLVYLQYLSLVNIYIYLSVFYIYVNLLLIYTSSLFSCLSLLSTYLTFLSLFHVYQLISSFSVCLSR